MTPAARAQAAIELLDAIVIAARDGGAAADTLIARYFKERRYAGSKDRRAVRELVYRAIRRAGDRPEHGRGALVGLARDDPDVAALFDGSPRGPAPIEAGEAAASAGLAPRWLSKKIARTDLVAMAARAPLDVRVNRLRATRERMLGEIPEATRTPHATDGLRFPEGVQIEQLSAFKSGLVEVQDEGSQLVSLAAGARPGMTVIDLCAGAGGKTLAMAAIMAGEGRLIACDIDRARLSRLAPRAERAGASGIETRLLDPGRESRALDDLANAADVVLIDAPCSGTGTWRRNPEARWRLNPARLARLAATQKMLLDLAARLVLPGGLISYVVCSLLDEEGADQTAAFLERHRGWRPIVPDLPVGTSWGAGVRLSPAHDGTDGFFVANLKRPC